MANVFVNSIKVTLFDKVLALIYKIVELSNGEKSKRETKWEIYVQPEKKLEICVCVCIVMYRMCNLC